MKPVLKWGLIGCGCLSSGAVALVVLLLVIGVVASSRGDETTVTTVGTAAPIVAKTGAPTSAPPPAAKPAEKALPVARIGDRVESAGIAITVNSLRRTGEMGQLMRAKPGRTYAVIDVIVESTAREKAPYNPLYFKVRDADGYEYTSSLIGPDNALKSGELAQGERVRGTVSFDVPAEAKGLIVAYQPAVLFGGYQTIRVQLE